MRSIMKLALTTAALFAAMATTATAATVVNGNFETGTTAGWSTFLFSPSSGGWQGYSGTSAPISGGPNDPIPAAIGAASAVADQTGEMGAVLYQDIALEAGMTHRLDFSYWVKSQAAFTATTNTTFAYPDSPEVQQVFIDVIKPTAAPATADPADTLASFYRSNLGDPQSIEWTNGSVDLSSFAGQNVRIRFLDVNQISFLLLGVDNVSITSRDIAAPAISKLGFSKARFRTTGKRAGTTVSLSLSEGANLLMTVEKRADGRRNGSKCVKPNTKNDAKKRCTRWLPVRGSVKATGVAGSNRVKFRGKLNRKVLAPGKYRLKVSATDAAGNSSIATRSFTILK